MHTEPRSGRLVPWLVGVGLAVAVASAWVAGFRAPGLVLGAMLAAGAVARLTLPPGIVGPLAVRSRGVDVAMLATLAVAVVVLALTAPDT
ncbi:MAG: DUF3017 domain-containing protein [Actinomycetes bacterium]